MSVGLAVLAVTRIIAALSGPHVFMPLELAAHREWQLSCTLKGRGEGQMGHPRHELLALLVKSRRRLLRCQELYREFQAMLENFERILNDDKPNKGPLQVAHTKARQA
jgi:hypothetical protein